MIKGVVVAGGLLLCNAAWADETNYCNDAETNATWDRLKADNRQDKDIQMLYSMRVRLCKQVDNGLISIKEATDQFEAKREAVIIKRIEHNRKLETEQQPVISG